MKLKETRTIDAGKVRAMCIRNDYYINGTNEQYSKMLDMCRDNKPILEIAKDIFNHSNIRKALFETGCKELEILENICFQLINDCTYTIVTIEEV